jgi:hypothetical protein
MSKSDPFVPVVSYKAKFTYKNHERDIIALDGEGTYHFEVEQDDKKVPVIIYKKLKSNKKIKVLVKLISITKL